MKKKTNVTHIIQGSRFAKWPEKLGSSGQFNIELCVLIFKSSRINVEHIKFGGIKLENVLQFSDTDRNTTLVCDIGIIGY